MASFLARRLGVMLLTMLCLTLIVFYLVNLEPNLRKLAISQTEMHASDEQLAGWLTARTATADRSSCATRHGSGYGRRSPPTIRLRARRSLVFPGVTSRRRRGFPAFSRVISAARRSSRSSVVDKLGPALEATGNPHVLGHGADDPGCTGDRDRVGHARGVAGRPRSLGDCDRHHFNPGICNRSRPQHHLRYLARLAQRLSRVGDGRTFELLQFHSARRYCRAVRDGSGRARDNSRLDGRGDERAIYPHRSP